jgi:hypothetical protein
MKERVIYMYNKNIKFKHTKFAEQNTRTNLHLTIV